MGVALDVLYLIGVAAFAASGVLAAHRARMDPFGAMVIAFVAGLSGGTVRDVLLDRRPLYWTHNWVLLVVIAAVAIATIVYLRNRQLPRRTLLVADALGLAVVTVIGARTALAFDVTPLAVVMLAVLTGVTGEVVRDVLCGEFPPLLLREEIYATAAMVGAVCYLTMDRFGLPASVSIITCTGLVFLLRLLAIYFDLHWPRLRSPHH